MRTTSSGGTGCGLLNPSLRPGFRCGRSTPSTPEQLELKPTFLMLSGAPAVEIVRYASDHAINLIVMGTHGRGVVAHALMGSVAEKVVRQAPCPVLTVRHPEREFVMPFEVEPARTADQGAIDLQAL